MNKRRALLASVTLLASGALVVSCSTAPTPEAAPSPADEKPQGEVTFWSSLRGMADVVAAYNESQDDIQVTFEEIPNGANGGYTKLSAAVESGTGPDVVGIEYYRLPGFVASEQVIAIDDLVPQKTVEEFPASVRDLVSFNDSTYALPHDAPPMIMWYRQDVLDAAGVEVPKTWEEFEDAARAVKEWNPDAYLASFFTNEPQLPPLAWQAGASWFGVEDDSWKIGITDKSTKKVADYWQGLIDDDLVKLQLGFNDQWVADLGNGTVNGWLGGSWSAASLKTRTEAAGQEGLWIAAEPPSWGDEPAGALSGGTSFAITRSSDNTAAAAAFMTWLVTTPEAVVARGDAGSAYLAYPGLNDEAAAVAPIDYYGNDIYEVFDAASSNVLDGWAWGPNFDITQTAMKDAIASTGSIPDSLEEMQDATVTGLEQLGLDVAG